MQALVLILLDAVAYYAGLYIALSLRAGGYISWAFYEQHLVIFSFLFLAFLFLMYLFRQYEMERARRVALTFGTLLHVVFLLGTASVLLFYLVPWVGLTPRTNLVVFLLVLYPLLLLVHVYTPRFFHFARPKALLVGGPRLPLAYDITNIVPINTNEEVILGVIQGMSNGRVLMSFSHPKVLALLPKLHTLMLSGVVFIDTDSIFEHENGRVNLSTVNELWLLQHMHQLNRRVFLMWKRSLDIAMVIVLTPLYILVLPFVALAIKLTDGGKVFIVQERIGLNHRPILLYKFRTMNRDDDGHWHKGDPAVVTRVGKFLRKSRIDELPQLWNIFKGDLSLIGPRPDMLKLGRQLASEIPYYNIRYIIRPGLTGWAQVTQEVIPQSVEETQERLAYDLYYIKYLSLFLELKIMLKTVRLLLAKVFS